MAILGISEIERVCRDARGRKNPGKEAGVDIGSGMKVVIPLKLSYPRVRKQRLIILTYGIRRVYTEPHLPISPLVCPMRV